jgi:hypothetical protein
MLKLELLAVKLFSMSFLVLNSQLFERVIVSFVIVKFFLVEVHNLVASHIQELTGVRDNNNGALAICDVVLKPHDCVQVQVVGWLV